MTDDTSVGRARPYIPPQSCGGRMAEGWETPHAAPQDKETT